MADFVPVAEVATEEFKPVAEVQSEFKPVAEVETPPVLTTVSEFIAQPETAPSVGSPLTPAVTQTSTAPMIAPVPATEQEVITTQAEGKPVVEIGATPATLPRFGKEGTLMRGVANVLSGLGEWALNRPEEALATLTPLGPAIAARYAPEMAQQWGENLLKGLKGNKEALGEALTMAAAIGLPISAKKAYDTWRISGPSRVQPTPPEQIALEATRPTLLPRSEAELAKPSIKETYAVSQRKAETLPVDAPPSDSAQVGAQVREQAQAEKAPQEAVATAEAATPAAAAPPDLVPKLTAVKDAAVDMQRRNRGLGSIMEPLRKSDEQLWDAALKRVDADPSLPDRLVRELTEKPRAMTDEEVVIIDHRMAELKNDLDDARWRQIQAQEKGETAVAAEHEARAGEISDALTAVEKAIGHQESPEGPGAGTIAARGFRARQLLIREDFSRAGLELAKRSANAGKSLNREQLAEVQRTADQFKAANDALQARLKEQTQALSKAEAERELAKMEAAEAKEKAKSAGRVKVVVAKVGEALDRRAEISRQRLRGKLLSLSPEDLVDVANIAASNLYHIGEDLGRWSAKMIEEIGEKVKPHLQSLWEQAHRIRDAEMEGYDVIKRQNRIRGDIEKYKAKIAAGDYSPLRRTRIQPKDKETLRLMFEREKVKKEWYEGIIADKMARRTKVQKAFGGAMESINAMRAVLTSADLSAVLRQGKFIVLSHPIRGARGIWPMLKAFASERESFAVNREIELRDNYPLMRASKLYLAEHGMQLSKMEEAYMSRWASKIPGVGPMVKASERAYTTFLNKLRADSFDAMARSLGRSGEVTPAQARIISNFINVATGRGTIGMADQAAVGLNTVFFAPRYVASVFQRLLGQPLYYGVLSGKAPFLGEGAGRARALVAAEYGRMLTGAAVVYALGAAAGAEIETDPRSSDFGKLRFGNTRIDPMAGLNQVTVLLSKVATGQKKTLRTGKIVPIRGSKLPFGSENTTDVIARFGRMKLAPAPGLALDVVTGTDVVGNPVTPQSELLKATVPISLQDIYQTMQEQDMPAAAAMSVLSVFGESVQNFDAQRRR